MTDKLKQYQSPPRPYELRIVNVHKHKLKIRNYPDDNNNANIIDLKRKIVASAYMMGVNEPPNDQEQNAIYLFIKKYFGDFSNEEYHIAMEMAAAQKLNAESESFGKLSISYIGKILKAYRDYRTQQIKIYEREEERKNSLENSRSEKQTPETQKKYFENIRDYYKENKKFYPLDYTHMEYVQAFQHMEREGIIKMDVEEKKKYMKKVKEKICSEIDNDKLTDFEKVYLKEALRDKKILGKECMKRLVQAYFLFEKK